jgi:hypothetical protein
MLAVGLRRIRVGLACSRCRRFESHRRRIVAADPDLRHNAKARGGDKPNRNLTQQ